MGEDHYYSVSEMASMFGLSRQALIYYDRIGLFSPAERNEAGYRLYLPTQIPTLRLICTMRDLGLSLDEIAEVVEAHDSEKLVARLAEQRVRIERKIESLRQQRDFIDQRAAFYKDVEYWRGQEGKPMLRHYDERHVVFEPFPSLKMRRELLHPTLSRAMRRLHEETGVDPVAGFGTMLAKHGVDAGTLAGAGSFATVPQGVRPPKDSLVLPAGEYACLARWGMPYDMPLVNDLLDWARGQGYAPVENIFDFCLLDATSYDTEHGVDYCVAQVRVG